MARINEPDIAGAGGAAAAPANVAALELALRSGAADAAKPDSLLIRVTRAIAAGEELLLAYGDTYDRSGYS